MGTHRRDVGRQLFGWLRSKILALTAGHWNFELVNVGRKSQNQDLRAGMAWSITLEKWNPDPETFLGSGVRGRQQAHLA